MKKSNNAKKQSLKSLDELVEVLDADKLREATGGLGFGSLTATRPREDTASGISIFQRLINPADLRLKQNLLATLVSRTAVLRQR